MVNNGLSEVPPNRPTQLSVRSLKSLPFYLKPNLDLDRFYETASTVVFSNENIRINKETVPTPKTVEELVGFFKSFKIGCHQSLNEEHLAILGVLPKDLRMDLRETGQCTLNDGCTIQKMGTTLLLKVPHGMRYRNHQLINVSTFNNGDKVSISKLRETILLTGSRLEQMGLSYSNFVSKGSISRTNILELAHDGYFNLDLLSPKELSSFYDSIKGPSFRAFVLGDSKDVIDSDLEMAYNHILEYTISPAPYYCTYFWDTDYHPEAAFCAAEIWVNMDYTEVTPIGVRVSKLLSSEPDESLKSFEQRPVIAYPYGRIKRCMVNLPTLWLLLEVLKYRLGREIGIISAVWVRPRGDHVYAWRNWARVTRHAATEYPELKYLYQIGATGGHYTKGVKVGDGEYEYTEEAYANESPVILSHLFDMVRVLSFLGATQSKKPKGIAADGWVSEGNVPSQIGPLKIGCVTYGPFPVRNVALELYYQFDQVRHDAIIDVETGEGASWRPRSEEFGDENKMVYTVRSPYTYDENIVDHPDKVGKPRKLKFRWGPSHGDRIPNRMINKIKETLGSEIGSRACSDTQVNGRIHLIRDIHV